MTFTDAPPSTKDLVVADGADDRGVAPAQELSRDGVIALTTSDGHVAASPVEGDIVIPAIAVDVQIVARRIDDGIIATPAADEITSATASIDVVVATQPKQHVSMALPVIPFGPASAAVLRNPSPIE